MKGNKDSVKLASKATVVLAPSSTSTVSAKKQETCTVGASDTRCPGRSSESEAAVATCTNPQGHPVNCQGNTVPAP
jgi:hypothetical protein